LPIKGNEVHGICSMKNLAGTEELLKNCEMDEKNGNTSLGYVELVPLIDITIICPFNLMIMQRIPLG
jgi:hypothetical protein